MKKKEIEKLPFLGLPKKSRKKEVRYIGRTCWKNIKGERHIILEVYKNEKQEEEPVVRYAATKKDWAVFFPESESWRNQKIVSNDWYEGLCWEQTGESGVTYADREKRNILYEPEDLNRIKHFFSKTKLWNQTEWWDYFGKNENSIKRERENKKQERRSNRLKEREQLTPELPTERILQYADKVLFHEQHMLYYKKHGVRATVACSKCGGVSEGRWKEGESYMSQFERHIEEPRDKCYGHCSLCGALGKYRPQGRMNSQWDRKHYIFLGDKYGDTGAVIRYIEVSKGYYLQEIPGEKGLEMFNSSEELTGVEIARAYYISGKKVQVDYHKHNTYTGNDFWDDTRNLGTMKNVQIESGPVMNETFENLQGTVLQYSGLKEYTQKKGSVNAIEYMTRYMETPQIEMMVKLKLFDIVEQLLRCRYGIVANIDGKRIDDFLGIQKEHIKLLMDHEGDITVLNTLQMEKRMGAHWKEKQIEALAEIKAEYGNVQETLQHMTIQKLLNRIQKYAGCEYGTNCTQATMRLQHAATTYFDYLGLRESLGYQLENTVYQMPRELEVAHARMVQESNEKEQDKRLEDVERRFPDIRKKYRSLRNKFFYEDAVFQIRPAKSATEIVQEGRMLHHCVGGDNYLEKHNRQESIILLLRFKEDIEIPYITVEMNPHTYKVKQWYGAHDKKPDEENMKRWIENYRVRAMCGQLGEGLEKTEEQCMQQLMAYA